jgi:hypothetical protein
MAPGIQHDEWRNRRRHIDFTDVGNLPEFVSESRHRSGYERRLLWWFNERPARSTDRRPKSAKERSRGRLGRGDAASYVIWWPV